MPKVNRQTARNDIYESGLKTKADNKQGYSLDRSKPANENDKVIVQKGQQYYSWAFRYGGSHISLTYPKPQQLTQSDFMIQMYDISDMIENVSIDQPEDVQSVIEDIVSNIESLRDQTQDSLDNMPESLQYSPTGELLQERVDACEEWQSNLEAIDCDFEPYEKDEDLTDEENEEAEHDFIQSWIDEKINEIQECSFPL